jgi:hypothetical protein
VTSLQTAYGSLSGVSQKPVAAGTKASLVLPAEAIDVIPAAAGDAAAAYAGNLIPVTVSRLQQIGHLVQMTVALPNGDSIGLEGHADKYGGRFAAGDRAQLAWKPAGATVIS